METIKFNNHNKQSGKFIRRKLIGVGLGFILVGSGIFAINSGLVPEFITTNLRSWQGILILLGAIGLLFHPIKITPWVFIGNGVLFLYTEHYSVEYTTQQLVLPAVLISIGLLFLSKLFNKNGCNNKMQIEVNKDDRIEKQLIFSGVDNVVESQNFKGGEIICNFGGAVLDLRKAKLSEEGENILDLNCVFGGVKLVAYSDMQINVEANSIFGGFTDKRENIQRNPGKPVLNIRGRFIFGGGVIDNHKHD